MTRFDKFMLFWFLPAIIGFLIGMAVYDTHQRSAARLPGWYAEVDSLYVWARDKR